MNNDIGLMVNLFSSIILLIGGFILNSMKETLKNINERLTQMEIKQAVVEEQLKNHKNG